MFGLAIVIVGAELTVRSVDTGLLAVTNACKKQGDAYREQKAEADPALELPGFM